MWYADVDGDGLGDPNDSQSACTQPSGYVSNSSDLCEDTTACNYDGSVTNAACTYATTWYADDDGDGLGDSSQSQTSCTQPAGYVSDDSDLCDDTTACNYDANPTEACATNDACGVCGGTGVDDDSDGICDDVDLCTDPTANNYTADPTEPCDFGVTFSVVDTIMGCEAQTDAIALDLDTLHSGTGSWTYSITQGLTGFASSTLSGGTLSIDFSASGADSARVNISGTNNTDNADIEILVVEGAFPYWNSTAINGGNEPTSPTGGMTLDLGGAYGAPVTVHYYEDALMIEDPSGNYTVAAYGPELTAMTDSSGTLITWPSGDYWIRGFTNQFGCFNPEPANSGTPTTSPQLRLITVPHLVPE